jgi:hypothetical protein
VAAQPRTMTPVRTSNGLTLNAQLRVSPQVWGAESLGEDGRPDGRWLYEREDSPGTPWLVFYGPWRDSDPHGALYLVFGSLAAARRATFDGSALAGLEALRSERVTAGAR